MKAALVLILPETADGNEEIFTRNLHEAATAIRHAAFLPPECRLVITFREQAEAVIREADR